MSHGLTIDLCLVQGLSMVMTSPHALSSNCHSPTPMQLMNVVKLGVKPSTTFILAPQFATKVAS